MHEAAIGFVRGRSVIDHARQHAGQAVVACFDLRDFFGCVRASRVHAVFATLGYASGICRAVTALVTCRAPEALVARLLDDRLIDHEHALRLRDAHLPQGAPTSPALANACAFNLDLRLDSLARAMDARYSRYADDLAISGGRALAARRRGLEAMVGAIAREEGFALNHRKSRSATRAGAQHLCGLTCNEHPNLPRREFDRLKALLHRCVRDGPAAHAQGRDDFRSHLVGLVAWARQVNPAKAVRLERDMARIDWQR
jgi:RNA-directed DNA polymerase